jgi:hypothetical protein
MEQQFDFFKTIMPEGRDADFYLGCLEGSVFIDWSQNGSSSYAL